MRLLRNRTYERHVGCVVRTYMELHDRFGFSSWAAHPRCALTTAEGADDAGEKRSKINTAWGGRTVLAGRSPVGGLPTVAPHED